MSWDYASINLSGNLHSAAKIINDHYPHWDVVAMDCSGFNTVVVYRTPRVAQAATPDGDAST